RPHVCRIRPPTPRKNSNRHLTPHAIIEEEFNKSEMLFFTSLWPANHTSAPAAGITKGGATVSTATRHRNNGSGSARNVLLPSRQTARSIGSRRKARTRDGAMKLQRDSL